MRNPLVAVVLGIAALGAALLAAAVQSYNHARAAELALVQRRCEMIEAANTQARTQVRAHVSGQPNEPLFKKRGAPAPRSGGAQQ